MHLVVYILLQNVYTYVHCVAWVCNLVRCTQIGKGNFARKRESPESISNSNKKG